MCVAHVFFSDCFPTCVAWFFFPFQRWSLQIDVKLQALLTEHGLECAPPLTTARLLDKLVSHLFACFLQGERVYRGRERGRGKGGGVEKRKGLGEGYGERKSDQSNREMGMEGYTGEEILLFSDN